MKPTVTTFQADVLFPRIVRSVSSILDGGKVVAPVQVIVGMGWLTPAKLEDWRFGRVPFLERVIVANLTTLSRFLRILRFHCHDLNLVPSHTAYVRLGGGPRAPLRFTKTGEPPLEAAYSMHFVWPGKIPFHPPRPKA